MAVLRLVGPAGPSEPTPCSRTAAAGGPATPRLAAAGGPATPRLADQEAHPAYKDIDAIHLLVHLLVHLLHFHFQ